MRWCKMDILEWKPRLGTPYMDALRSTPLLFASTNVGKCAEVRAYSSLLGVSFVTPLDVASSAVGGMPTVVETEADYEGNAGKKARSFARWSGLPTLADDTGLEIEALGGLPGLFTGRWGVGRVQETLGSWFTGPAEFVCCMAYAEPAGRVVSVTSRVSGVFSLKVEGVAKLNASLPFSAFFIPQGYSQPLSVLIEEGELVSHRFLALRTLLSALRERA